MRKIGTHQPESYIIKTNIRTIDSITVTNIEKKKKK